MMYSRKLLINVLKGKGKEYSNLGGALKSQATRRCIFLQAYNNFPRQKKTVDQTNWEGMMLVDLLMGRLIQIQIQTKSPAHP